MEILIDNRSSEALDVDKVEALARFVLTQEHAPDALELSISYVDTDEIQELNQRYRGKDCPTDVLSFECDSPEEAINTGQPLSLGDVIICPRVAYEHAREFDSSLEHEMALMLTHGILHLLGFDHINDDEATAMETRENALLDAWFKKARQSSVLSRAEGACEPAWRKSELEMQRAQNTNEEGS